MKTPSLLGFVSPDSTSQLFGVGYQQFRSPYGIDGLAQWTESRLDLLAVVAHTPGIGQFREFMKSATRHFKTIVIWEIWNPWLEQTLLKRYGFMPCEETMAWGEVAVGVKWERKP